MRFGFLRRFFKSRRHAPRVPVYESDRLDVLMRFEALQVFRVVSEYQHRWRERSVRKYYVKDERAQVCRISHDILLDEFLSLTEGLRVFGSGGGTIYVPLQTMARQMLAGLSFDSPWKAQATLLTSEENSLFALCNIFGFLESQVPGVALVSLSHEQVKEVFDLLHAMRLHTLDDDVSRLSESMDQRQWRMLHALLLASWDEVDDPLDQLLSSAAESHWDNWVRNRAFREFVFDQIRYYVLVVAIPRAELASRVTIKIEHSLTDQSKSAFQGGESGVRAGDAPCGGSRSLRGRWKCLVENVNNLPQYLSRTTSGLVSFRYVTSLGQERSTHLSVVFPEGYLVEYIDVVTDEDLGDDPGTDVAPSICEGLKSKGQQIGSATPLAGQNALGFSGAKSIDEVLQKDVPRIPKESTLVQNRSSQTRPLPPDMHWSTHGDVGAFYAPSSPTRNWADMLFWVRVSRSYYLIPSLIAAAHYLVLTVVLAVFASFPSLVSQGDSSTPSTQVSNIVVGFIAIASSFVSSRLFVQGENRLTTRSLIFFRSLTLSCYSVSLLTMLLYFISNINGYGNVRSAFAAAWVASLVVNMFYLLTVLRALVPLWGYRRRAELASDVYRQEMLAMLLFVVLVVVCLLGIAIACRMLIPPL